MTGVIHNREFPNLSSFVAYVDGPAPSDYSGYRTSRSTDDSEWYGSRNWDHSLSLAFNDPDTVAAVQRARIAVNPGNERPARQIVRREMGPGALAIGDYLAGHPQPYVCQIPDPERVRAAKGPVIRVTLNCIASGGISASTLARRGASIIALCEALERAGRKTAIDVIMVNDPAPHRMIVRVNVKRAGERFNVNTIAYALGNPGMLRRFMFSYMELQDAKTRNAFRVQRGYGHVGDLSTDEIPPNTLYFGGAMYGDRRFESDRSAAAWVRATAESYGVNFK